MQEIFANENIVTVELEKEVKKSYIDYAMSVIVGRALPDVRDGLKPVHRRILYTMYEGGLTPDKAYRKSATTVGDVLGKYHPHGDAAVYDSIVRMAQEFSLRYPLIDGQGNFGSVDGDSAAHYRYTEARMTKSAISMLADIEKDTVDFVPNYDERLKEPSVLPSRIPQLLVNGSSGIAVGMATNIPPHNIGETIDAVIATMQNPEISIDELTQYLKGPDFPTAGIIMGRDGIKNSYHTGRGKIVVRGLVKTEDIKNKRAIIVTELPYQVNKATLIGKIAELVRDKRIEGISDLRDESNRNGMRIVIELKRDANSEIIINQLYKFTQLEDNFSVIMLALVDNQPRVLNLKQVLENYIDFQKQVIVRRTKFEKRKAELRLHILEGFLLALKNIDKVIELIKRSYGNTKQELINEFNFTEIQAQAVLDMRLARLSGLEHNKIENEHKELTELISRLTEILGSDLEIIEVLKTELLDMKNKYNDKRKTEIVNNYGDIDIEDLIADEDCVITRTHFGYIKRQAGDTYRVQKRGGKGVAGMQTREEDFAEQVFVCNTKCDLFFFTNMGRVHTIKAYKIQATGRQAKGTAVVNLIKLRNDEKVTTIIPVDCYDDRKCLIMITRNGTIKRVKLSECAKIRKDGLNIINLVDGDLLVSVEVTNGNEDVIICTREGMSVRFNESKVRVMGRGATGVRGIRLYENDYVVNMCVVHLDADSVESTEKQMLVLSENGFGKRVNPSEYRTTNRGGRGVISYRANMRTGKVVASLMVDEFDDLIIVSSSGQIIRIPAKYVRILSRTAIGVTLMKSSDGKAVGVARIPSEPESEPEIDTNSN